MITRFKALWFKFELGMRHSFDPGRGKIFGQYMEFIPNH